MNCTVDLSDRLPLPIQEWPDDRSTYQKKRWPNMPRDVAIGFAARGYRMDGPFRNAIDPIPYTCLKEHSSTISWNALSRGNGCAECSGKVVHHEDVLAEFEGRGYTLLSEYKSSQKHLRYICPDGHAGKMSWSNFRQKKRCAICRRMVVTHDQVFSYFASEGYTLLGQYSNNRAKLDYICPENHRRSMSWKNFSNGKRCPVCTKREIVREEAEAMINAAGYEMLDPLTSAIAPMRLQCPKSHIWKTNWNNFQQGSRCGECSPGGYKPSEPGMIYYLRFDLPTGPIWKIGITNKRLKQRFSGEKLPYVVVWSQHHKDGKVPPAMEKKILKKYKAHQYKGLALHSGNTECFTIDVLGYDKPIAQLSLLV